MKSPPAPKSWANDARKLWRWVHETFMLDEHHECLLRRACEMLTRADEAREIVAKEGLATRDRYGCLKPNPLLESERAATNAARLLLRELHLDGSAPSSIDEATRIPRGQ